MAGRRKYTWYYNGIKVTRRWLEFNYGRRMVADFTLQADVYFSRNPRGMYHFNNGVSCSC